MSARFRFILDPVETAIRRFFKAFGYEILKMGREYAPDELAVFTKVRPYTGTSIERVVGLMNAVKYVTKNRIEGDFVECGVWCGGSMMAAMLTLLDLGDTSRHFYFFDTYEGMTPPTDKDVNYQGTSASELLGAYGHWQGSRRAVDEYFAAQKHAPLLNKLDHSGRLIVKPG